MARIKVCSFNLRFDTPSDGINAFSNRLSRVLEVIREEKPDLIGFQEATDGMRKQLADNLPEYTVLGCGRGKDYRGESTAVAVLRDRFELISCDNFWLSPTPRVPGSRFAGVGQSGCPRVTTCIRVKPLDGENTFRFCNTHLDHKGETARLLGIYEVMQYLSASDERFVLVGDLNALPDSEVIAALGRAQPTGREIVEASRALGGTFHYFGKMEKNIKIDYIFTDGETDEAEAYMVEKEPVEGVYVSDHHPIFATIEI